MIEASEQADGSPMPNRRKSENVIGSGGRVGAASKTTRERAAKQRLTGHSLEPAIPHVPSGIVMRAAVIAVVAALDEGKPCSRSWNWYDAD
jgi:hypothetical protein